MITAMEKRGGEGEGRRGEEDLPCSAERKVESKKKGPI
jgi:hypothetical protein